MSQSELMDQQTRIQPAQATSTTEALTISYMAVRDRPAEWYSTSLPSILALVGLPSNWDSYGSYAANDMSLSLGAKLLQQLSRIECIEQPTVTLSPAGNCAFVWDNDERSLDLEVLPNGKYRYVLLHGDKEQEGVTSSVNEVAYMLTAW